MRLVLVTQDFPPARGGIQTWALEIARRLASRCERFAVVAPAADGREADDAALGFRVIRTGTSNTLVLASAPTLARLATRDGFDHTLHAQWSTAPAARVLRRFGKIGRVAIAAHGRELLLEPWARVGTAQRGYDRVRRRELAAADCVLAGSRYTAELARGLGADPARVLVTRYGTDPERFRPRDATELRARLELGARPVLLTIARLVPRKGIDSVLGALAEVRRAIPDVVYVIAGDGPDRERLEALVRRGGLEAAVRFAGAIADDELPTWYSLGDVFVMPSRSEAPDVEGFGIVFLEAAACERPVVAARAGGVPDAVADGVTGLLVEPGDERGLARALAELLADPARRAELGRRGRERVLRELTWEAVANATFAALSGPSRV
ncbi:MAG TPA: glycosyltransferase family 4 protein [Polyangiaceae bacterium]